MEEKELYQIIKQPAEWGTDVIFTCDMQKVLKYLPKIKNNKILLEKELGVLQLNPTYLEKPFKITYSIHNGRTWRIESNNEPLIAPENKRFEYYLKEYIYNLAKDYIVQEQERQRQHA